MNAEMNSSIKSRTGSEQFAAMVGGGLLAVFGALVLVDKFVDLGKVILFYPGFAMFVLGVLTRKSGWFIPAGILTGLGLAASLRDLFAVSHWTDESGISCLGFALGWFSISLFSTLFTKEKHLWALIPGGILALTGAGFLLIEDPVKLLDVLAYAGPAALILVGLALILVKKQN